MHEFPATINLQLTCYDCKMKLYSRSSIVHKTGVVKEIMSIVLHDGKLLDDCHSVGISAISILSPTLVLR